MMRSLLLLAVLSFAAAPLAAQAPTLRAALSGRATTEVSLSTPRVQGQPAPTALKVKIDYGQPHARGRAVPAELAKPGTVWRTGANSSTTLTTDLDLVIGGLTVPKGSYSLYSIRTDGGYELIINRNTGQWGTEYVADKDLGRVKLTARTLTDTVESLAIALVPTEGKAAGQLTIAWGKLHLATEWAAK